MKGEIIMLNRKRMVLRIAALAMSMMLMTGVLIASPAQNIGESGTFYMTSTPFELSIPSQLPD